MLTSKVATEEKILQETVLIRPREGIPGAAVSGKYLRLLDSPEKAKKSGRNMLEFSMESLQFLIRVDWTIESYSKEAKEQFFMDFDGDSKTNLKKLLIRLNPSWALLLKGELSDLKDRDQIFLPWEQDRVQGMGWCLYLLGTEERYYVTLSPMMCPGGSATLSEESLDFDTGSLQQAVRQLFLRTQQQEGRFRYFVRHLPGAHFRQDESLNFMLASSALKDLLGSGLVSELRLGVSWLDWVHPSDRQNVSQNLESCRHGNLPVSFRFRLLLPDSDRVLYLMELRIPVRGIDGQLNGFEGIWLDLTREELAQQRLQHSSWKESLAEISGSLSHDFNNLLGGLCSMSNLVLSGLDATDSNHELVGIINKTANQAKDLSGRIISLNREEHGHVSLCNLVEIVEQQLDLVRIILPKDATLDVSMPEEEVPVRVDPVAVRRVLVNFATNARDALDFRGQVQLKMREIALDAYDRSCLVSNNCGSRGRAVEFIFKDDGPGIPPEIISRIFGAYFSTKDCSSGSGSGLGLYCLTQFAKENNFDYGVRSELGVGTEMILVFPLIEFDESESDSWESESFEGDLSLVEDEPSVAIFGSINAAISAVVRGLEAENIGTRLLSSVDELETWIDEGPAAPRTLIMSFAYNEHKSARRTCEELDLEIKGLQSILSLQGLNPDQFSDIVDSKFDSLLMANGKPASCLAEILGHLRSESL